MKTSTVIFVTVALLLASSFIHTTEGSHSINCDSKCEKRCREAEEKDKCLKSCRSCCEECKCVPSSSGNKHECACYRDMKNSKGNPRCP